MSILRSYCPHAHPQLHSVSLLLTCAVHFPTVKYLPAAPGNQPTSQQIVSPHKSKYYHSFGRHERTTLIAFAQCEQKQQHCSHAFMLYIMHNNTEKGENESNGTFVESTVIVSDWDFRINTTTIKCYQHLEVLALFHTCHIDR